MGGTRRSELASVGGRNRFSLAVVLEASVLGANIKSADGVRQFRYQYIPRRPQALKRPKTDGSRMPGLMCSSPQIPDEPFNFMT